MTWTHNICGKCWRKREGARVPVKLTKPKTQRCCFCGTANAGGIYVRHNPDLLDCQHRSPKND